MCENDHDELDKNYLCEWIDYDGSDNGKYDELRSNCFTENLYY